MDLFARLRRSTPWLIGFLGPIIALELALRIAGGLLGPPEPWPNAGYRTMAEAAAELNANGETVDVLFLGSSITDAAIDPTQLQDETAIASFNAAGPFSGPISAERWLTYGLWDLQPATLVIGLPVWGADGSAEDSDLLQALNRLEAAQQNTSWLNWSALWQRRGQLRQPVEVFGDKAIAARFTSRGHYTGYYDAQAVPEPLNEAGTPFPGVSDDQLAALTRTAESAAQQGVTVVLMLEPGGCPPVFPNCATPASVQLADELYRQIAQDLDVEYFNARTFEAEPTWYADSAHFNEAGTRAFTSFVGGWLADR